MKKGDVIGEKYRIETLLTASGTSVVLAATDTQLGRRVVIKSLARGPAYDSTTLQRLARENRAALRLKSKHVVRVFETGTLEDGRPFVVMEHLDGIDLQRWLLERGPLPVAHAVTAALHVCDALREAHELGLVHRDLKPAHLFALTQSDGQFEVKLLDFCAFEITRQNFPLDEWYGTTNYMSPEQLSLRVDARSDLWSLGVTLYELVSGQLPFQAGSSAKLLAKIVTATPAPLRAFLPRTHTALEGVISKCLEKDPARRYQTARELSRDLLAL